MPEKEKEYACYCCRIIFEKPASDKKDDKEVAKCPQCGNVDVQKLDEQGMQRVIRRLSFG